MLQIIILTKKIDLNIRFDLIYVEKDLKSFKFTHFKEMFIPTID